MCELSRVEQKTEWFKRGKYGVMMHFLGAYTESDASWNARVDTFDCDGLAEQLHKCGAKHLLFTISQTGGRFCMPIASYTEALQKAGYAQTLCSERDLVADLIGALDRYGISLMLYAAVEGPIAGELKSIFPWDSTGAGPGEGFTDKYFAMLRELSLRYGKGVKGWWIDGCYAHYKGYFDANDTPFMREMAATLRAGNPDSIIAFNSGLEIKKLYVDQDYTCGESNELIFYPEDRLVDGVQWHVLSYLGPWWSDRFSARSNIELVNYTKTCTDRGGVLTYDVGYDEKGHIVPEHFEQLCVLRRFIKDSAEFSQSDIPESEDYLNNTRVTQQDGIPANYVNIALGKKASASSTVISSTSEMDLPL